MNKLMATLGGLSLGAGLMYWLDPDQGRRRRSLVRDKAVGTLNSLDETLEKAGDDLRNRARGLAAETRARFHKGEVPDWILEERVRAELGRVSKHPSAIEVSARQGQLTLRGPALASEVDKVVAHVESVRGVKSIDNQLNVHQSAEGVPGLQGQPRPRQYRRELMQENWTPSTRLLTGTGGGLVWLYGWQRGGLFGKLLGLGGAALALRGITNLPIKRLTGTGGGRRAIDVQKAINIQAPVEQVYAVWSNFTNFPRFMAHVCEVRDLSRGNSHWVVAGPAGMPVEWDAVITRQEPNEIIAWKSLEGQAVKSAGVVRFEPNPQGGTRVTVRMSYNPPAGALGHAVASLLGADPKQAMDEDLVRLKSLLETGKTTGSDGQEVRREQLIGAAA